MESSQKNYIVRPITLDELEAFAPLGYYFAEEIGPPLDFDQEHFMNTWANLYALGIGQAFGLYEDGNPVGTFGATLSPNHSKGTIVASEVFWFVHKSARGHGLLLLNEFERWALEHKAERIDITRLVTPIGDKLDKLYRELGYIPAEIHYFKELV